MIVRDYQPLYKRLDDAHDMLFKTDDEETKLALANYIGNVYRAIICMGDGSVSVDKYRCFGGKKNYQQFMKKLDSYSDELMENFLRHKDFHEQFFGEILPDVEEGLADICKIPVLDVEELSERDFFDILYLFLDSIHLEKVFDEFYKNHQIYSSVIGQDKGNLGFTLYNPVSSETDLFIKNFQFNFPCMNTLVHEFGHGFDLKRFRGNIQDYNSYFYVSFFGEVIPRVLERLLHQFCIKNNVLVNQVKDDYVNFEDISHDYLLASYVLSLLDSAFLKNDGFIDCDSDVIVKKIQKHFLDGNVLKEFIERMQPIDLSDTYCYSYGDILSMFLSDEAEKNGMNSELMEYFYERRTKPFDEEFMRECGFGPANYVKLYKKEIELIKK